MLSERRQISRFQIRVPAAIWTLRSKPGTGNLRLLTDNVSAKGVFVMTSDPLPVGSRVGVSINLHGNDASNCLLIAAGRVVRTEAMGMAIHFDKSSLQAS